MRGGPWRGRSIRLLGCVQGWTIFKPLELGDNSVNAQVCPRPVHGEPFPPAPAGDASGLGLELRSPVPILGLGTSSARRDTTGPGRAWCLVGSARFIPAPPPDLRAPCSVEKRPARGRAGRGPGWSPGQDHSMPCALPLIAAVAFAAPFYLSRPRQGDDLVGFAPFQRVAEGEDRGAVLRARRHLREAGAEGLHPCRHL